MKTATIIQNRVPGFRGYATLYKLNPPMKYQDPYQEEGKKRLLRKFITM